MPQEARRQVSDSDGFGRSALHHQLPAPALEALAREVLTRMGPAPRHSCSVNGTRRSPPEDIEGFCALLLSPDSEAARHWILARHAAGLGFSRLYLDILTPAAHRLGAYWEEDTASFADVSMGVGRIYAILHHLRDLQPFTPTLVERHAVFATLPGDAHTLGATVAADVFRDRGWEIDLLLGLDHDSLVDAIDGSPAPVLGISAATSEDIDRLLRLVVSLHVRRPALRILVAGNLVNEEPDLTGITGIDAAEADFEAAYRGVTRLLDQARRRPAPRL